MITPNEVRIGNLVMYEGKIYEIDIISKEMPFLNTPEYGVGVVSWKDLEPIPLTEEWLLKYDKIYGLSKDVNGYFVWINGDKIYIKYVHSLQNLYWSLNGKELNLNL